MLYITGQIDEKTYKDVCHYLDEALVNRKGKKAPDVHIELNSPGGDVMQGLAIYGRIRQYPGTVHIYAIGQCHSAAVLVYIAGDVRYMASTAWTMLHEGSYKLHNAPHSSQRSEVKAAERIEVQYCQLLEKATGIPSAFWEEMCEAITYLSAEECIQHGLAHRLTKEKD